MPRRLKPTSFDIAASLLLAALLTVPALAQSAGDEEENTRAVRIIDAPTAAPTPPVAPSLAPAPAAPAPTLTPALAPAAPAAPPLAAIPSAALEPPAAPFRRRPNWRRHSCVRLRFPRRPRLRQRRSLHHARSRRRC
jgi:hypothetical protein